MPLRQYIGHWVTLLSRYQYRIRFIMQKLISRIIARIKDEGRVKSPTVEERIQMRTNLLLACGTVHKLIWAQLSTSYQLGMQRNFSRQKLSAENGFFVFLPEREKRPKIWCSQWALWKNINLKKKRKSLYNKKEPINDGPIITLTRFIKYLQHTLKYSTHMTHTVPNWV